MDSRKPHIFLFIDLDETLIDTQATTLNEALLDVIKEFNITDVCLFTSMDSGQLQTDFGNVTYSRPAIINTLKDLGLTVHKVITPGDALGTNKPGDYYATWKETYDRYAQDPQRESQDAQIKMKEIDDEMRKFQAPARIKMDAAQDKIDALEKEMRNMGTQNEALINEMTQAQAEKEAARQTGVINKGQMYQRALDYLDSIPKETSNVRIGSIIAIEDRPEERDHIQKTSDKNNNAIPLTIIPIHTRNTEKKLLPDIPATKEDFESYPDRVEEIKERYREKFIEHFKKLEKKGELTLKQRGTLAKVAIRRKLDRAKIRTQNVQARSIHAANSAADHAARFAQKARHKTMHVTTNAVDRAAGLTQKAREKTVSAVKAIREKTKRQSTPPLSQKTDLQHSVASMTAAVKAQMTDETKYKKFLDFTNRYFNDTVLEILTERQKKWFNLALYEFSLPNESHSAGTPKSHSLNRFTSTIENELIRILQIPKFDEKTTNKTAGIDQQLEKRALIDKDWAKIKEKLTSGTTLNPDTQMYATFLIESIKKLYEIQGWKNLADPSAEAIKGSNEHKAFMEKLGSVKPINQTAAKSTPHISPNNLFAKKSPAPQKQNQETPISLTEMKRNSKH